jgi:diacylglycerol kinase (ATP)
MEFGIDSLDRACRSLKEGKCRRIDLGSISRNGMRLRVFLGQANIGLGALVNISVEKLAGRRPWLGRRQMMAGILGILGAYRTGGIPVGLTIASDAGTTRGRFTAAVFANIRYWATGRLICPSAKPDDGELDSCLIAACPLPRLLKIARLAGKGRHGKIPGIGWSRSRGYEVSSEASFIVQTDGEILGGTERPEEFRRVTFEALPGALEIIA